MTVPGVHRFCIVVLIGAAVTSCAPQGGGAPSDATTSVLDQLAPCDEGPYVAAFLGGTEEAVRDPDGYGFDLWGVRADGRQIQVTQDGRAVSASLTTDGREILLALSPMSPPPYGVRAETTLVAVNAGTGAQTELVTAPDLTFPRASPDGSLIAVIVSATTDLNDVSRVALIPRDNPSAFRRFPADADSRSRTDYSPVWSPDGSRIAMIAYDWAVADGEAQWSLRVVDIATGNETIVYTPSEPDTVLSGLDWSESGEFLLTTSGGTIAEPGRSAATEINLDTGDSRELFLDSPSDLIYTSRDGASVSATVGFATENQAHLQTWILQTESGTIPTLAAPTPLTAAVATRLSTPACALR